MNYELNIKEILKEVFLLTGEINNKEIIDNLIKFIKNNKNEKLSYNTHVKGHFTGFNSLNENIYFINFIKLIHSYINKIFTKNFYISEAWGNICKINEEVTEHTHEGVGAGFCGIFYLSENGPGTYFREYDIFVKEKIGKFILFHPCLRHSVPLISKNIERITVAFNAREFKSWDNLTNVNWIKNEI